MKKILVAEDDELNRMVIKEMLALIVPNVNIEIVDNGLEAYLKLKENSYDLILTDIDMPKLDGRELLKKVKGELHLNIPIICVTAFAVTGDKERLLLEGFDDYLSKPIDMNKLGEVIRKFLGENID
ncbi:response regulator [Hydrogenimonas thermophila]|uniref:Two-component system, cell cycle response regulator DivK n=1 Tax=Hydrogenimonas thermophila TaxID=223786 RepID=A0A1I5L5R2_9BACT|nr:response regulator [Hydrogenimonas thermophila]WOE70048.1 response regulator [Hydrogenimonas thermophila]WOE72565.1 response regulator [Hydrogenimonas thermophila]SFO92196.1 two-component system, cell cycle response regulator DivK [Hydrogenimonas thermophila]